MKLLDRLCVCVCVCVCVCLLPSSGHKVDREERPDVDRVYMKFIQAVHGSGGWPMSVFLTPELEPFSGGTYFPPTDRFGQPGFATVLKSIAKQVRHDLRIECDLFLTQ